MRGYIDARDTVTHTGSSHLVPGRSQTTKRGMIGHTHNHSSTSLHVSRSIRIYPRLSSREPPAPRRFLALPGSVEITSTNQQKRVIGWWEKSGDTRHCEAAVSRGVVHAKSQGTSRLGEPTRRFLACRVDYAVLPALKWPAARGEVIPALFYCTSLMVLLEPLPGRIFRLHQVC